VVVIDARSRERQAEESAPERTEGDFTGLLDRATQAGIRIDIQTTSDGIRFSWRLPPSASVRPTATDVAHDRGDG
jgi:hypothetical protein